MSETWERHGSKLTWNGKEVEKLITEEVTRRLYHATGLLRDKVQSLLAQPGTKDNPSQPGEPPHHVTDVLWNSIFAHVDERTLTGSVGSSVDYSLWLEFGTAGGQTITSKSGTFSWVDPKTGKRIFAKTITLGRILPRPFLRPALQEAPRLLLKVYGQPMKMLAGGVHAIVA